MKKFFNAAIASVVAIGLTAGMVGCSKQEPQTVQSAAFDEEIGSLCLEDIDREDIPPGAVPRPSAQAEPIQVCIMDDDRGGVERVMTRQQVEAEYGADMWPWYASAWSHGQMLAYDDGYINQFDSNDLFLGLLLGHLLAWNLSGQQMTLFESHGGKHHKSRKAHASKRHAPKTRIGTVPSTKRPVSTPAPQAPRVSKAPATPAPKQTSAPRPTTKQTQSKSGSRSSSSSGSRRK